MSPIFPQTAGPGYVEHPFGFVEPLLSGDAGVEQTVAVMRELVDEALRDPSIIRLAADIVRGVPAFDDYAEANALYDWVKQHIRFTKDPVNKEKLYPPAELLKIRAGDCDDISMLLSTLLMAVGYPARLMTIATPGAPDQFSHVYVEAEIPPGSGHWIAVDPARADSEFGIAPPITTRARWWSLVDNSYGDLSGYRSALSGLGHYPRFRSQVSGMGAYGSVHRRMMGDTTQPSGAQTSSTIATIEQGTADIIRASEGIPASPFAYQSGPWSSFATPFTPGANMPPAGYTYNAAGQLVPTASLSVSGSSNWVLGLAIGFGALLLVGGRK